MKLFVSIKYLAVINGRLYYRRRYPLDLKDRLGAGNAWRPSLDLKVGEELKARMPVEELARKHDKEIKRLREHQGAKPVRQLQTYKDAMVFAEVSDPCDVLHHPAIPLCPEV